MVQSLPTQGSTSWKCKVCLGENKENVALCCDCGSDRNIADNVIESTRKKFEPKLIATFPSIVNPSEFNITVHSLSTRTFIVLLSRLGSSVQTRFGHY